MPTDKERMDFLESLKDRPVYLERRGVFNISGGVGYCSIITSTNTGVWQIDGSGETVREAINAAINASKEYHGA